MKLYKLYACISILFLALSTNAQSNSDNITSYNNLSSKLDGYYQIQVVNSRAKPTISYDLLTQIEANREQIKNTFIQITPEIRVFVLRKGATAQFESDKIAYIRE